MKRSFCLGSEWLYYKLYMGVKTTDIFLSETLFSAIEDLTAQKVITKWFFIRYNDPKHHLRIRIYCENKNKMSKVINTLYPIFNDLLENDLIWKVQTDTYQRELERYGEKTIIYSENLFWLDSNLMIKYFVLKDRFRNKETALLFSYLSIDSFLNSFQLTNDEKIKLFHSLESSFKLEFEADKALKKEFDKHFRDLFSEMENIIIGETKSHLQELKLIVEQRNNSIQPSITLIKDNIEIPLFGFLQSHVHMMLNRQFNSNQRVYECLVYDQLHRYYKKIAGRNKMNLVKKLSN